MMQLSIFISLVDDLVNVPPIIHVSHQQKIRLVPGEPRLHRPAGGLPPISPMSKARKKRGRHLFSFFLRALPCSTDYLLEKFCKFRRAVRFIEDFCYSCRLDCLESKRVGVAGAEYDRNFRIDLVNQG